MGNAAGPSGPSDRTGEGPYLLLRHLGEALRIGIVHGMQHAFAVAVEASGPDLPGAARDVNGDWGAVGNQRAKYVQSSELGGFQSIDEGNARLSHKPKAVGGGGGQSEGGQHGTEMGM